MRHIAAGSIHARHVVVTVFASGQSLHIREQLGEHQFSQVFDNFECMIVWFVLC